jgi:hypothetical protein
MLNNMSKILIISETFKSNSGGGITLTNLFKDYPKEYLANAVEAKEIYNISTDSVCGKFYSLGFEEKKVLKLFSFLQKKYPSGEYVFQKPLKIGENVNKKSKSIRAHIIDSFFSILHITGIYHLLYRYEISEKFSNWIVEFKPDFIYTQLSSRESILFTEKLIKLTGASLAIHLMDDWPSTISKTGFLKKYWRKRIDNELRSLIDKADVLMSISDGMSVEYKRRYNMDFQPFHNPIDINRWIPFSKTDIATKGNNLIVLYAGRIGLGTSDSILDIAKVIENLNESGYRISYHIQTTTSDSEVIQKLRKFQCVKINKQVEYSELPAIFSEADLLVMPIDFSKKGIQFLKYSMPTKASEYMISGTPILLYADESVSLVSHAQKHGWANIVSKQDKTLLKSEIINVLTDYNLRLKLSKTAKKYAIDNFDSLIVREQFRKQFRKDI